jgi:signal transduction histidine kinase/DNA-binding NarL/FixJ family response regulator
MPRLQLLHLEDDECDAALLRRTMGALAVDADWTSAPTAAAFQDAVTQRSFDAILSDNRVPGIEGLQAMAIARQHQGDIPFIFVSGNRDPRKAEQCLKAGATDYVCKDELWRLPGTLKRLDAALAHERLRWLARSRGLLVEMVKQLSLARTEQAIVAIVRGGARALTGADGVSFVLRDGDQCHYVDEDAIGPLWKGCRFPMATCISGWAMLQGKPAAIADVYVDPRIPHDAYRPTFVKSLVMVPIRKEAPLGALGCYWAREHEATPEEIEIIQALADSTSLAFENLALFQSLDQRVQQRTTELTQANQDLEAFAFSVSHDLRAPLRAMRGFADLLRKDAGPTLAPAPREHLDRLEQAGQRMDALIDDMLSLSRVARAEIRRRPVALDALAASIVRALRSIDTTRHVKTEIQPGMTAHGDTALLRLALENLLANAWKFTGRRDDACIAFVATPAGDGEQVFCLRDNGAGFDMRHAHQLFEPFRRLHSSSEFPGTGVGLAIVRRVVRRHGGEVWVESSVDRGTSLFFTLPSQPGDAAQPALDALTRADLA